MSRLKSRLAAFVMAGVSVVLAGTVGLLVVLVLRHSSAPASSRTGRPSVLAAQPAGRTASPAARRRARGSATVPAAAKSAATTAAKTAAAPKPATATTALGLPSLERPGVLSGMRLNQIKYASLVPVKADKVQRQTGAPAADSALRRPSAQEEQALKLEIYTALTAELEHVRATRGNDQSPEFRAHLQSEEARLAELGAWLRQHGVIERGLAAAPAARATR